MHVRAARIHPRRSLCLIVLAFGASALAAPPLASAHLERPSYWPDPAPDTSVNPPAGGKVPKARSLASAVTGKGPGEVRVVCKGSGGAKSLALATKSIRAARERGFRLRPSQPKTRYTAAQARKLLRINRALAKRCQFRSIQRAVDASGNNDRVVIMPGRYTEPKSRQEPVNDPKCNPDLLQQDQSGALTPSYEYQTTCPNDQNLVYVQGRAVKGEPLASPDPNRHGIPEQELGACVRCNLQIEGSGVKPEDVLIDGGKGYRRPLKPGAQPSAYAKHVVMRTDRSDGFVGRNFLLRGALEHGFYTEETDGVLLDRVKFYWAADYGHLSFTTDHNVIKNCDGFGAGDAVVYPGASPQTGDYRNETFYPFQRLNTVIKRCDLHGSSLAYSGSMGNSVRLTRNHVYGNAAGIAGDTLSPAGHPGFPADGMQIDRNWIYSNNLNLYTEDPPVEPLVPSPVGTGIVWPGMNDGNVTKNWIFDNWRSGATLIAIPDAITSEPEGNIDPTVHCPMTAVAHTSCGNRYHDNVLGQVPPGFKFPTAIRKFGNESGAGDGPILPNGVDFWWDEFPGTTGNCWFGNVGPDGTPGSVTSGAGVPPDPLPSDCETSVGLGDTVKEAVLFDCAMWERGNTAEDHPLCDHYTTPPKPGTSVARAEQRTWERTAQRYAASDEGKALHARLDEIRDQALQTRHR